MLFWPSPQESLAWLQASDEGWAERFAIAVAERSGPGPEQLPPGLLRPVQDRGNV